MFNVTTPAGHMADHLGGLVAGVVRIDPMPVPYWLVVAVARWCADLDTLTDSLSTWFVLCCFVVVAFGVVSAVMYPKIHTSRLHR